MSRKGENIYKRKDGRWEGRYIEKRIDGRSKYKSVYARSYKEVKTKLYNAKLRVQYTKEADKVGTLKEISNKWLKESKKRLKLSSVNKYEDILRCYILPEFGEKIFSEISTKMLIKFLDNLEHYGGEKRKGLSASIISSVVTTMKNLRIYAIKNDYSVNFTMECIDVRHTKKEIRIFTFDEERRLIHYLSENMNYTSLGIIICLFTGLRVGEVCALKWDDINFSDRTVMVSKTMQRIRKKGVAGHKTSIEIMEPKSACSVRTIPLSDNLINLLAMYYKPGAFLLSGDNKEYVEPRTIQYRYQQILRKCNIGHASFHTMRHTFATRCVEVGFDPKSLSEILGHVSVAITMNRYVHPSMKKKAENMELFSNLFTVNLSGQMDRK